MTGARLLVVNCHHHEFKCVPIGSFGLCDYLDTRGFAARIFNAALYAPGAYAAKLEDEIRRFAPTHVGIVVHWKELLENALYLAFLIRTRFPGITLLTGGLTSGFLAEDLLAHSDDLDFVVKGDPEAAVEALLRGEPAEKVPNLFYRDDGRVRANALVATEKETLDATTFTRADLLADHRRYVDYLETFLGWPLMVGRGCAYDCDYCGGSKKAFKETGDRRGLTLRSKDAILRDMRTLAAHTDYVFLGNEPSKRHMYGVLEAIAADPELRQRFRCGYNTFKLMDPKLLELLPRAFRIGGGVSTLIEVAPETTIEEDRPIVRDPALDYTNEQLIESVRDTHQKLPGARTVIYFSRYHQTHTREKLMKELENIHAIRARLFELGLSGSASITYCFLSTDVGSANWDQVPVRIGTRTGATELLLKHIRRYERGRWPDPPLDGLCIYRPDDVDDEYEVAYTRLAKCFELLLLAGPYPFLASRALGYPVLLAALTRVVAATRTVWLGPQVALQVLELAHQELEREAPERFAQHPAFFSGALAVARGLLRARNSRNVELPPVEGVQLAHIKTPTLARDKVLLVEHPFLSLGLYHRLAEGLDQLAPDPRVVVLGASGPKQLPARFMPVFEAFDGRHPPDEILARFAPLFDDEAGQDAHDFIATRYYDFTT